MSPTNNETNLQKIHMVMDTRHDFEGARCCIAKDLKSEIGEVYNNIKIDYLQSHGNDLEDKCVNYITSQWHKDLKNPSLVDHFQFVPRHEIPNIIKERLIANAQGNVAIIYDSGPIGNVLFEKYDNKSSLLLNVGTVAGSYDEATKPTHNKINITLNDATMQLLDDHKYTPIDKKYVSFTNENESITIKENQIIFGERESDRQITLSHSILNKKTINFSVARLCKFLKEVQQNNTDTSDYQAAVAKWLINNKAFESVKDRNTIIQELGMFLFSNRQNIKEVIFTLKRVMDYSQVYTCSALNKTSDKLHSIISKYDNRTFINTKNIPIEINKGVLVSFDRLCYLKGKMEQVPCVLPKPGTRSAHIYCGQLSNTQFLKTIKLTLPQFDPKTNVQLIFKTLKAQCKQIQSTINEINEHSDDHIRSINTQLSDIFKVVDGTLCRIEGLYNNIMNASDLLDFQPILLLSDHLKNPDYFRHQTIFDGMFLELRDTQSFDNITMNRQILQDILQLKQSFEMLQKVVNLYSKPDAQTISDTFLYDKQYEDIIVKLTFYHSKLYEAYKTTFNVNDGTNKDYDQNENDNIEEVEENNDEFDTDIDKDNGDLKIDDIITMFNKSRKTKFKKGKDKEASIYDNMHNTYKDYVSTVLGDLQQCIHISTTSQESCLDRSIRLRNNLSELSYNLKTKSIIWAFLSYVCYSYRLARSANIITIVDSFKESLDDMINKMSIGPLSTLVEQIDIVELKVKTGQNALTIKDIIFKDIHHVAFALLGINTSAISSLHKTYMMATIPLTFVFTVPQGFRNEGTLYNLSTNTKFVALYKDFLAGQGTGESIIRRKYYKEIEQAVNQCFDLVKRQLDCYRNNINDFQRSIDMVLECYQNGGGDDVYPPSSPYDINNHTSSSQTYQTTSNHQHSSQDSTIGNNLGKRSNNTPKRTRCAKRLRFDNEANSINAKYCNDPMEIEYNNGDNYPINSIYDLTLNHYDETINSFPEVLIELDNIDNRQIFTETDDTYFYKIFKTLYRGETIDKDMEYQTIDNLLFNPFEEYYNYNDLGKLPKGTINHDTLFEFYCLVPPNHLSLFNEFLVENKNQNGGAHKFTKQIKQSFLKHTSNSSSSALKPKQPPKRQVLQLVQTCINTFSIPKLKTNKKKIVKNGHFF